MIARVSYGKTVFDGGRSSKKAVLLQLYHNRSAGLAALECA